MTNHRSLIIIVIVLIISNVFFAYCCVNYWFQLKEIKNAENSMTYNKDVLSFSSMFIKDVLQADKEVDFETRLKLENAVRSLNDEQIMAEWQSFTSSKTEREAQNSVKRLLGLLVEKISSNNK